MGSAVSKAAALSRRTTWDITDPAVFQTPSCAGATVGSAAAILAGLGVQRPEPEFVALLSPLYHSAKSKSVAPGKQAIKAFFCALVALLRSTGTGVKVGLKAISVSLLLLLNRDIIL